MPQPRSLARTRMRTYDDWKADDGTNSDEGATVGELDRARTWVNSTRQCPGCKGSGRIHNTFDPCPTCNGAKRLPKETA